MKIGVKPNTPWVVIIRSSLMINSDLNPKGVKFFKKYFDIKFYFFRFAINKT
jgi:hypothetical protein